MRAPQHYRDRADEIFALAGTMTDPEAQRKMLRVVADYELFALVAEQLASGNAPQQ